MADGRTALRPAAQVPASPHPDPELARLRSMLEQLLMSRARARHTRPQPVSLARRADIITAAIHIIARDGIRACTITALADATGFARGHFTYHFDSKAEIIGLAFATVGADFAATQAEATVGDTAAQRVESRVRSAVAWTQRRPEYFRCLMNFRVEMLRDPAAFKPAARIRAQIFEVGAQMVRDGLADGSFRGPLDPAIESRVMFAAIDGVVMHAAMDPTFAEPDALGDLAWQLVADRLRLPG